jgi:hypothetical protein
MMMGEKIRFILGRMWDFLAPFIRILMTQAGELLAQAAMEAVTAVQSSMADQSGEEKRKAAFEAIEKSLLQNGVKLGASVINMAIEAAVNRMKE